MLLNEFGKVIEPGCWRKSGLRNEVGGEAQSRTDRQSQEGKAQQHADVADERQNPHACLECAGTAEKKTQEHGGPDMR